MADTTIQERWESGLIHQFAKLAYSIRVPGVRIPPSPQPNPKRLYQKVQSLFSLYPLVAENLYCINIYRLPRRYNFKSIQLI